MRTIFRPQLVNGPAGDIALFIDCQFEKRALLFDLGDIGSWPPRKLLRIRHVFVSHTHMDHFIGFDWLLRLMLGREKTLHLYGPPDFLAQVEHKLCAYTWNLVQNYATNLTLIVTELDGSDTAKRASFCCCRTFRREHASCVPVSGNLLLREPALQVRYALLDHGGIPCLAYALEETAHVNLWKNRLHALGLATGPWLRDLKQAVLCNAPEQQAIQVSWREKNAGQAHSLPLGQLKSALRIVPGQKIAYITDAAWHENNRNAMVELANQANLLYIETAFMERDAAHGLRKSHLTARQAGEVARAAGAGCVIPMHFSSRYKPGDWPLLRAEVAEAFSGKVL